MSHACLIDSTAGSGADNCPGSATCSASGLGFWVFTLASRRKDILHGEAVLRIHGQHKALRKTPADGKNSVIVTLLPRPESLRRWVQISLLHSPYCESRSQSCCSRVTQSSRTLITPAHLLGLVLALGSILGAS